MADILAVISRVSWQRIDDEAELKRAVKLVPAGDYIVQALIENPPADPSRIHDVFFQGIQNGSAAFHETEHRTAMPLTPIRSHGITHLPRTRLLFLDFSVTRSDVKRFSPMSQIDTHRAALTSLVELRTRWASEGTLLSLAWSPTLGSRAFALAAETQHHETLGQPCFPSATFPELARLMEQWDLQSVSPDPHTTPSRLRI